MPLFHYKTVDKAGKQVEGTAEAKDKFALYHSVKQDGSTVIFVEEVSQKKGLSATNLLSFLDSVKTHDKITFARNLGTMLEAGLSLSRALSVIERQSKKEKLKELVGKINQSIEKGKTFSDTLGDFPGVFSTLFISMVKSGEESGG